MKRQQVRDGNVTGGVGNLLVGFGEALLEILPFGFGELHSR